MLKLTNSFCRYFGLSQNIKFNKTHVKKFTHLNCISKRYGTECVQKDPFIAPFIRTTQQLPLFSNIKKKLRFKTLLSNDSKRSKQMSESMRPTLNHISYGGQFSAAEEDTVNNEWMQQFGPSGSTNYTPHSDFIPFHPPNFRAWEPVENTDNCDGNTLRFRVLSYNVLAQYLLECHPYLYTKCCPQDLKWKVRASRLYDEIIAMDPDILCFQEVQASHLCTFYAGFERIGYAGIFKQKTGHRHDGCAIYYRQSMFELVDHLTVEFYQPELPILNRHNIGMIVKLVPRDAAAMPIVVATTHLLYNPKRTDVRLAQMQVFLAEIDRFAYFNDGQQYGHYPIILTGDFNSTPDSAVVQLVDRGFVSVGPFRDRSDRKKIAVTDNCQHLSVYIDRQKGMVTDYSTIKIRNSDYSSDQSCEVRTDGTEYDAMFNKGLLGHSLKLTSVYDTIAKDNMYLATTCHKFWVMVDYIYFSRCSSLKLIERLRLPTASQCKIIGKLPNGVFASDHLALAATFALKPHKSSL